MCFVLFLLGMLQTTHEYVVILRSYFHRTYFAGCLEDAEMESWRSVPPDQWSNADVLNFIYTLAAASPPSPSPSSLGGGQGGIDVRGLRGERFQGLSGKEILAMSREQFVARDPLYGGRLHELIELFGRNVAGISYFLGIS